MERIEHETPIDLSHLVDRSIKTRAHLNAAEFKSIRPVMKRYLSATPRNAKFDSYSWFMKLHEEMYHRVWTFAGQPRKENLNIGVDHVYIATHLAQLIDKLAHWPSTGMPALEQAARLHYEAVWIHPFLNGNGRWARMLADIYLKSAGEATIDWPSVISTRSPIRTEYIDALKRIDRDQNWAPFLDLHQRYQGDSS